MGSKNLTLPLDNDVINELQAGDSLLLTGHLYMARETLPFDLQGQVIYYVGPTTSGRIDQYIPALLDRGLKGIIGKGLRNQEVIKSIKQYRAVYFAANDDIAALMAKCVQDPEYVACSNLGAEGIRKLYVKDLPVIVVIDVNGKNYYEVGRREYLGIMPGGCWR